MLGTTLSENGVTFRLWAPHATQVSVIGSFNDWDGTAHPMQPVERGHWLVQVEGAKVGDPYKYQLVTSAGVIRRIDPYAREVTSSVGNAIIHDAEFDWSDDHFTMPPWNQLIIYELHVGTFNDDDPFRPGKFITITARLEYLKRLGVNAIQIMPVGQFAGMRSWGYNPSHLFAVDSDYGGSLGLKRFIKRAHQAGIAVILDVVYNHFGPAIWISGNLMVGRRMAGAAFTSIMMIEHSLPGAKRALTMAVAKCVNSFLITYSCGLMSIVLTACASIARSIFVSMATVDLRSCQTVGACFRRSMKRFPARVLGVSPLRKIYKAITGSRRMLARVEPVSLPNGTRTLFALSVML